MRRLMAVAALALLAAACGGDAPVPGGLDAPTATATATALPPPAPPMPSPSTTSTPEPVEPTATTGALAAGELPVVEFVRADGSVAALRVEVPPRDEYHLGLSGRYELGERGMLFHYAEERTAAFWMRNTHIDLDIAFVGADFAIVAILRMEADTDDFHQPDRAYRYAVEAPAGWYAAHGVAAGDRMRLTFELPSE